MAENKNKPFYIFTIALCIGLIVPALIQDGMFMDGILYTVASKNLAHGIGTWWTPQISATENIPFHEQPPMMFWLLSFFFRVFGDSIYTERIYALFTAVVAAWLITKIWKLLFDGDEKKVYWLPLLFWIIPPVCFWTYANNMEECTMNLFILSATWFVINGLKNENIFLNFIIGGVLIFLSSLCKGVQSMFVLVIPFLHWLFYRKHSFVKMMWNCILLVGTVLLCYFIILQNDTIEASIRANFEARIVDTFNDPNAPTTGNRFYLMYRLLNELLGPAIICILMLLVFKIKKMKVLPLAQQKTGWLFLLIGICGSLPLMITLEQRRFYLVPSLAFFAIALASVIAPGVSRLVEQIDIKGKFYRRFSTIAFVFLFTAITVSALSIGKTKRDKDMLHDVYAIGKVIPQRSVIGIPDNLSGDYVLILYFARHYNITLVADKNQEQAFFLSPKNANVPDEKMYSEMNITLSQYRLLKKNK